MDGFSVSKPSSSSAVVTFPKEVIGGPEAMELSHIIRECIAEGRTVIVLDLEDVSIMNSSGLGMLVSSLTTVRKQGAKLCLAAIPEKVTSLLAMTQLSQIFDVYPTVSEAVGKS